MSMSRLSCASRCACSNMADDEKAVLLACRSTSLVLCALDLYQSQEQLLEKVRWICPPQSTLWRRPEYVSCESRLSWRVCHAALPDKRDKACTSRLFPVPIARARKSVVSCHVVTWRAKWNLGVFGHMSVATRPTWMCSSESVGWLQTVIALEIVPVRRRSRVATSTSRNYCSVVNLAAAECTTGLQLTCASTCFCGVRRSSHHLQLRLIHTVITICRLNSIKTRH